MALFSHAGCTNAHTFSTVSPNYLLEGLIFVECIFVLYMTLGCSYLLILIVWQRDGHSV